MRNKDGIKNCCIQVTGFLDCFCSIGNAEKSSAPAGPSRSGRDIETLRKNLCARKLLFRIKALRSGSKFWYHFWFVVIFIWNWVDNTQIRLKHLIMPGAKLVGYSHWQVYRCCHNHSLCCNVGKYCSTILSNPLWDHNSLKVIEGSGHYNLYWLIRTSDF